MATVTAILFSLAAQTRAWQVKFVQELVYAFATRKIWDPATVIVTHKGQKAAPNMGATMRAIFEADKVYDLAGKKVSSGEIFAKADAYDLKHAKAKADVVVEGRHRISALWLVAEFFGIVVTPEVVEVNDDMAKRIGFEANLTNESFAKMLNTEKLGGIVELIRNGTYAAQKDIPCKHGRQQALWHQAQAVIVQGVTLDEAVKLSAKEAAQVTTGVLKAEDAIAARAGNAKKVLPGDKLRDCQKICKNYDPESKSDLSKLLNAIIDNAETTAKQVLVEALAPKVAKAE